MGSPRPAMGPATPSSTGTAAKERPSRATPAPPRLPHRARFTAPASPRALVPDTGQPAFLLAAARHFAGEGEDELHRLVPAVGGRLEHQRAAAVDDVDAVLVAVVGGGL